MSSATFQSSTRRGLFLAAIKANGNNANEWESLWIALLTEPKRKWSIYTFMLKFPKSTEDKENQQLLVITVSCGHYWPHVGLLGFIMHFREKSLSLKQVMEEMQRTAPSAPQSPWMWERHRGRRSLVQRSRQNIKLNTNFTEDEAKLFYLYS